jgi:predicted esterase
MTPSSTSFVHRFVAAADLAGVTLLLLHGTGGSEHDLIPLGQELLPGAALLSPRGRVLENGMPRFFRRLAEGVFDQEDLRTRTDELARFVTDSVRVYGLRDDRVIAVGYSNGANIAASLLLRHPRVLSGAVLFRPMVPFRPNPTPHLKGMPVFMAAGSRDPVVPAELTSALAEILQEGGARISIHWHPGGHELGSDDVAAARDWLAQWPRTWSGTQTPPSKGKDARRA